MNNYDNKYFEMMGNLIEIVQGVLSIIDEHILYKLEVHISFKVFHPQDYLKKKNNKQEKTSLQYT